MARERCQRIHDHLGPDASKGDNQALIESAMNKPFRRIRIEGGQEVHQRESHRRHTTTVMFASMGVGEFMNADNEHSQRVHVDDVYPCSV